MTIKIENRSAESVSWFVFNKGDVIKGVALASGDLGSKHDTDYDPPANSNDEYVVRFTVLGGGRELAAKQCGKNGTVAYS